MGILTNYPIPFMMSWGNYSGLWCLPCWVNIDQKEDTGICRKQHLAKQTIAHNTVVVNEISHYDGDVKGEAHYPVPIFSMPIMTTFK